MFGLGSARAISSLSLAGNGEHFQRNIFVATQLLTALRVGAHGKNRTDFFGAHPKKVPSFFSAPKKPKNAILAV
jgi:hypothetical protein